MINTNLEKNHRHPASFRDPAATVFEVNGRIIRALTAPGVKQYTEARESGLLNKLEDANKLIKSHDADALPNSDQKYVQFIEHTKIPFISYPYEWSFLLLKEAALLHLDIQLEALDHDFVLSDASAYNIQFQGISPIFIDVMSFRKYEAGELWKGHRQFCEHFLNPLLLFTLKKIPHHAWYRGSFEGIPTDMLASLMPLKSWFSMKSLAHVLLPARYQHKKTKTLQDMQKHQKYNISKNVYCSLLRQLRSWIEQLKPKSSIASLWENYDLQRTYDSQEMAAKRAFIADFCSQNKPELLWDLGCNDGEFSEIALKNGAAAVIGFDLDVGALNKAVMRAKRHDLNFLPLYQEINNPSPGQGWLLQERAAMTNRGLPNAVIALAFVHHLILGHNIPMAEVIAWLLKLAPKGIVEFVEKTDPTVQIMLALKGDIFPDYSQEAFVKLLQEKATIIKSEVVSASGRCLYWYEVKA